MSSMPEYDPDRRQVKRIRSRWAALWEDHTGRALTPRQRGYLNLTGSGIWKAGLDPDRLILDVLLDWPDYVQFVTSKGARVKYSTEELRRPHLDFFCQTWRLYCGV